MDSLFSVILERLNAQDRISENRAREQAEANEKILARIDASDVRTTLLERWKDVSDTRAGMIAGAAAAVVSLIAYLVQLWHGSSK
jgi:hypothetical protein